MNNSLIPPGMEIRIGNKYKLGRKLGSGSFGEIYIGYFLYLILFVNGNLLGCPVQNEHLKNAILNYPIRVINR